MERAFRSPLTPSACMTAWRTPSSVFAPSVSGWEECDEAVVRIRASGGGRAGSKFRSHDRQHHARPESLRLSSAGCALDARRLENLFQLEAMERSAREGSRYLGRQSRRQRPTEAFRRREKGWAAGER